MSQDLKFDVSDFASQLIGDKLRDSTKFDYTLRHRNSIIDQNDNSDHFKAIDYDFNSTQIGNNNVDRINFVALSNKCDLVRVIASNSDQINQSDHDQFQDVDSDSNIVQISDDEVNQTRSNNNDYLQAVSDDYLQVVDNGCDDVQITGEKEDQSGCFLLHKHDDYLQPVNENYSTLQLARNSSDHSNYENLSSTCQTALMVISV